ncbi:MAG: arginase family protein [Alistipes sp.]
MEEKTFTPDDVGIDNGTYFGLPFEAEAAELVLISAPWDVTVSYGAGAAYAPDAIIEASTQLDFCDPLAPQAWRRGIATADIDYSLQEESQRLRVDAVKVIDHLEGGGTLEDDYVVRKIRRVNEGCVAMNANIEAQASHWLDRGKKVGLVGGDHSTPYGLICALGRHYESFGVLHIDAHCDLRDSYEGFEFSHASIFFNVLRDVPQVTRIAQVAVRDFSEAEAALAASSERIVTFDDLSLAAAEFSGQTWDAQCQRIAASLPTEVYISFDIDGLTFENCPHTGTPVSGGLTFNKAIWLIHTLVATHHRIIGFDVVEVSPVADDHIDAITGARVLWKLCGQLLQSNTKN